MDASLFLSSNMGNERCTGSPESPDSDSYAKNPNVHGLQVTTTNLDRHTWRRAQDDLEEPEYSASAAFWERLKQPKKPGVSASHVVGLQFYAYNLIQDVATMGIIESTELQAMVVLEATVQQTQLQQWLRDLQKDHNSARVNLKVFIVSSLKP